MSMMLCQLGQKCVMEVVLLAILSWVSVWAEEKIIFDRHAVYWNSSNPKWVLVGVWHEGVCVCLKHCLSRLPACYRCPSKTLITHVHLEIFKNLHISQSFVMCCLITSVLFTFHFYLSSGLAESCNIDVLTTHTHRQRQMKVCVCLCEPWIFYSVAQRAPFVLNNEGILPHLLNSV